MGIRKILMKFSNIKAVFSHRTIYFNLMIALVFIAILPATIINLFYYSKMNKSIENRVQSYSDEIIKHVGQKLDYILDQTEFIKKQVIAMAVTSLKYEPTFELIPESSVHLAFKTDDLLRSIILDFKPILDIYLIESNGNSYSSNRNKNMEVLLEKPWVKNMDSMPYTDIITPPHLVDYEDIVPGNNNTMVLSFIKKINLQKFTSTTGIIQIDLKYSIIEDIVNSTDIGKKGFVVITDADNKIIYCPEYKFLGKATTSSDYENYYNSCIRTYVSKRGMEPFTVNFKLTNADWNIQAVLPQDEILTELTGIKDISVLITVFSIIFSIFLSYVLSKGIVRPIEKIIRTMKNIEKGDFNITVPDVKNRDLHVLSSSFNMMVNRINLLMRNIIEKETEKSKAQLKALQAQINPHFLYNTLGVIRNLATGRGYDDIAEITLALSQMFRYSINKDMDKVTIKQEIEHVKNYIIIQKYRFGNKIDVTYEIDEEILQYKIIPLVIQPLVENAVYHGIEMKVGKGKIKVCAQKVGESIFIQIIDNGLGMSKEKVDILKQAFKGDETIPDIGEKSGMGIGIINVNTRLKLAYGEKYGLDVSSIPKRKTTVQIYIPAIL